MTITTSEESLVFFECGDAHLAGILTIPGQFNGYTVLIPWGSSTSPSSGRNRIRTHLARGLASHGFAALRFDYPGVGESTGNYKKPDLARPYANEILAAYDWLKGQNLNQIIVVAQCFGGWSSLVASPRMQGLAGMALVNAPTNRGHKELHLGRGSRRWWSVRLKQFTWRKLLSAKRRKIYRKLIFAKISAFVDRLSHAPRGNAGHDGRFTHSIKELVDRAVPVLLAYGDDDFRADFEWELDRGLRTTIENAAPPTRLVMVTQRLVEADRVAQNVVLEEVLLWLSDFPGLRTDYLR